MVDREVKAWCEIDYSVLVYRVNAFFFVAGRRNRGPYQTSHFLARGRRAVGCCLFAVSQVVVNLDPTMPELGTIDSPLKSMHDGRGCKCQRGGPSLRLNHYLGSIGDYMDRTKRYWKVGGCVVVERVQRSPALFSCFPCTVYHLNVVPCTYRR